MPEALVIEPGLRRTGCPAFAGHDTSARYRLRLRKPRISRVGSSVRNDLPEHANAEIDQFGQRQFLPRPQ